MGVTAFLISGRREGAWGSGADNDGAAGRSSHPYSPLFHPSHTHCHPRSSHATSTREGCDLLTAACTGLPGRPQRHTHACPQCVNGSPSDMSGVQLRCAGGLHGPERGVPGRPRGAGGRAGGRRRGAGGTGQGGQPQSGVVEGRGPGAGPSVTVNIRMRRMGKVAGGKAYSGTRPKSWILWGGANESVRGGRWRGGRASSFTNVNAVLGASWGP